MFGNKIYKERLFLIDSDINWLILVIDYLVFYFVFLNFC